MPLMRKSVNSFTHRFEIERTSISERIESYAIQTKWAQSIKKMW